MPGPSPTACRARVHLGSTGIPSNHWKSALLPGAPAHDSLRSPSARHSRCFCSHLGCTVAAVCPIVPCSIQLPFPVCSEIPWLSPPPQPPHPRPACHQPCSRLLAYLLPSSWNPRGWPPPMPPREVSPLPACRAIRRLLQWRCDPLSSHLARAQNATPEFFPCPSAFLPRVRAQSLPGRSRPPSRWHWVPASPSN